jgi:RNA polymerase sigma-70 factor (ECF subfamily)
VANAIASLRLRVTAGEAEEFEAALGPLIEQAHRLATAMLHDPTAAQDAVQEASIKAWRKIDRLRPDSAMGPWFLGIVANECRTTLRSRWRRSVVPLQTDLLARGTVENRAVATHDTLRALGKLRHRDRLVVALHFYLDMPVEQIAQVIGTSEAAAKARLYRAIHALRRQVGEEDRGS